MSVELPTGWLETTHETSLAPDLVQQCPADILPAHVFHEASIEEFAAQTSLPRIAEADPGDLTQQQLVPGAGV
jgi:hypothetical protein